MSDTVFSLIPPILVIMAVLISKKVLLSILLGIISSSLIIHSFNIVRAIKSIVHAFVQIVYTDGGFNRGNLYLIAFLLLLGILTSFISKMGGTDAFALWARKKVKNGKHAQFVAFILGIVIFIDDYFNALTVGEIAGPLTDQYKVSREKLAYIIDSTSAPVCVISPISSWGAYIIALLGGIFLTNGITDAPFIGFLKMVPYNFYAILSLFLVVLSIVFSIDFGKMKNETCEDIREKRHRNGSAKDLLVPIILMIVVTIFMMWLTGYKYSKSTNIITILENADTYFSLFLGALTSIFVIVIRYEQGGHKEIVTPIKTGVKSMLPSVFILCFAWALIELISEVGTGVYLSQLFVSIQFEITFLPFVLFIISGFMALATGTSWGTFGVMLPIGAQIAMNMNPDMLFLCLGAVISGSVFGDHCSPISDTTILSSTGAKCNHIDHVTTQLPYALLSAVIASIGFIVSALTNNLLISYISIFTLLFVVTYIIYRKQKSLN